MNDDLDADVSALLGTLDPERRDPGYWGRFHRWVVNSAVTELARRRRAAEATVTGVMLSWWRTLVPVAAAAAVLAGFLLLRRQAEPQLPDMTMDELLREGVEAPVMPSFETDDPAGGIVVVNEIY